MNFTPTANPRADDRTSRQDFEFETLPWLDRPAFEVTRYVESLDPAPADPAKLRRQLLQWMTHGYVVLEKVIDEDLIAAYEADLRELLDGYREFDVRVDSDVYPVTPIRNVDARYIEELKRGQGSIHLRLNDFHNYSVAGKRISLHPGIVQFLRHLFHDTVVVLQSLTFFTGSEQALHGDYAFVPAKVPSQLVGSWVALEDIEPDSGPLRYIPGSHVLPKFEWGDGIFRTPSSSRDDAAFAEYIKEQADLSGLEERAFCPRRGDALIWHGALAHGGSAVTNRVRTRRAHVSHYSKASVHLHDYRDPSRPAERIALNGGFLNRNPFDPSHEDVFRNAERI